MRPSHPPPARDAALLLARLVLGTIMVAHACQQLGGLTGLEHVSIPVGADPVILSVATSTTSTGTTPSGTTTTGTTSTTDRMSGRFAHTGFE